MQFAHFDDAAILEQAKAGAGKIEYRQDFVVWFTRHAVKDEVASKRLGRPIYVDATYFVRKARDVKDFVTVPATEEHYREFPAEFAAFSEAVKNPRTPINALPRMTPCAFMTLQEIGVHTIEDFAAKQSVFPELEDLHAIAKRWMAETSGEKKHRGWPKGKPRGPRENSQATA